ncbi:MAG TPA: sigma-70 family RNA polymerase sigma factor [Longimicrobiaceae bacterium]|nr:sigma-70 family RNA polymerase sigma factor [Longimicrobiaceae bacterium]
MPDFRSEVTRLVSACVDGNDLAFDELFSVVYDDLRAVAHRQLRKEAQGHTLHTTALVHEAYLNLVDQTHSGWRDRAHFFAIASTAMRHILIDYARRRGARKRGGIQIQVPLRDNIAVVDSDSSVELLELDDALNALSVQNPRMARIVECRFFGGMTVQETAEALDASVRTVEREWTRAKAHLYLALRGDGVTR